MCADTTHAVPSLTDTSTLYPITPAAIESDKIHSNCARSTDGQTVSLSPPANLDIDIMLLALETVMASRIMSSRLKTHPRARPTRQTSRDTSPIWRKCTRSQRVSLKKLHNQWCFFPTFTSSKFQSLMMPRPACRKATKTMAPHRQLTLIPPCRTPHERHLGSLCRAFSTSMCLFWRHRPSSVRGRPPRRLPPWRRLHVIWCLLILDASKSRRPLGWMNHIRQ